MNSFLALITSNKFKGAISLAAAVVMYFTPDNIDAIIQAGLTAYGCVILMIEEKNG
ncbi:MAG: hypothetical protein LBB63_00895 [Holosporaceae bacterium]|jgi:hypothetical protein|nr:hypothetical protein [Holosporaceae bacterium]